MRLEGFRQLQRTLQTLDRTTRGKIVRGAVSKAATPVLRDAKRRLVPGHGYETGLLRKSLGRKAKQYRRTVFTQIIGPRRGFRVVERPDGDVSLQRGTKADRAAPVRAVIRNPVNYAHLVELGTSHSPAYPFLRPALESNRGRVLSIMRSEIGARIEREAASLGRRKRP
jgi:HK97 gp10 family phage protein